MSNQNNKKEYQKVYRQSHKAELKRWRSLYYQLHKKEKSEYAKKYRKEHMEKDKKNKREWYKKNREVERKRHREYHQTHLEYWNKKAREYYISHKELWLEYSRRYRDKKRLDPKFRLDGNMARIMGRVLKGRKAGQRWETLVNYTLEDLIEHLEKQFDENMSWNNYGFYWWVDHIKPKSLFNYRNPEDKEFKECWALENLQPMEKIANIRKNNHYESIR